jgi:hypothetical protein
MFESAEGPTTQGIGALVWPRDGLFVLRCLRSYAVEGSHGGRVEWRDGGWGGYMRRRKYKGEGGVVVERRGRARAESRKGEESLIEKETPPNLFGRQQTVEAQRGNGHSVQAPRGEATAPNDRRSHNNSRVDCPFSLPRGHGNGPA